MDTFELLTLVEFSLMSTIDTFLVSFRLKLLLLCHANSFSSSSGVATCSVCFGSSMPNVFHASVIFSMLAYSLDRIMDLFLSGGVGGESNWTSVSWKFAFVMIRSECVTFLGGLLGIEIGAFFAGGVGGIVEVDVELDNDGPGRNDRLIVSVDEMKPLNDADETIDESTSGELGELIDGGSGERDPASIDKAALS